jgi:hypothetical protein
VTTQRRVWRNPLAVGVLLACVGAGCLLYGRLFDGAIWNHPKAVSQGDRLRMVNDLTFRHLRGLTREQVVGLLGPSDDPSVFFPELRQYPEWDLVYMLGSVDPFWAIGPGVMEVLVIRFGPDGRISEYRVGHGWKFRSAGHARL